MRTRRVSAPGRVPIAGPWTGQGGPGDLGSQIGSAWSGFLAQGISAAEVALGAVLIFAAVAIVLSQTSAAQTAGRAGVGAARRGARFIPGVGALA